MRGHTRTTRRLGRRPLGALAALCMAVLAPCPAWGQNPQYTPTMYWETGLIDVPAAWASPLGGDMSLNVTRVRFDRDAAGAPWWYAASGSASLWGRAEAGLTVLEADLKVALFAKALIWDQLDGEFRRGVLHWLPSIAVGIRNAGTESRLNRFARPGSEVTGTSPTLYAVATRTQVLARDDEGQPRLQAGVTAGIGNGLFAQHGGLDTLYGASKTGGAFAGLKLDLQATRFTRLSLMVEHNAWDVNVGAAVDLRGVRVGVHLLEPGAGLATSGRDWSYRKMAMTVGFQTNARALVKGDRMSAEIEALEASGESLRRQMVQASDRVAQLEQQLRALQGRTTTDAAAQRAELEQRLREEQEALKRLQERLGKKP